MSLAKNRRILISLINYVIIMFFTQEIFSQTSSETNLFMVNKYSINPAYAGKNAYPHLFVSYKNDKTIDNNSISAINIGFSSNIFSKTAIGARYYQYKNENYNIQNVHLDYSYLMKFSQSNLIRLGFSTSLNSVTFNNPDSSIDSITLNKNNSQFGAAAGIVYNFKKIEWSIALPNILNFNNEDGFWINSLSEYNFSLSKEKILITPGLFIRYNPNYDLQYHFNLTAMFNNAIWFGASYGTYNSISLMAGIKYSRLALSYANQLNVNENAKLPKQSHEVSISFTFTQKTKKNDELQAFAPIENWLLKRKKKRQKNIADNEDLDSINNTITANESSDSTGLKLQKDSVLSSKKKYVITEIGDGVYMVRIKLPNGEYQNMDNRLAVSGEKASDEKSILMANMLGYIDNIKEKEDFELVEIGEGIFVLKTNKGSQAAISSIPREKIDSLILNSGLFEQIDEEETNLAENAEKKYVYSIQLLIDDSNRKLLGKAEIQEKLTMRRDSGGNNLFFWGRYYTIGAALKGKNELEKFENLKTKLVKFGAKDF